MNLKTIFPAANWNLVQLPQKSLQKVAANPLIRTHKLLAPEYSSADDFIRRFSAPEFISASSLPETPNDIRGIDSTGYTYLNGSAIRKYPSLVKNRFFEMKFFPHTHYICRLRKSNIALGNFNNSVAILNDPVLEKAFKSYSGTYKSSVYVGIRKHPLSTALGRARYKKLIKRLLWKSVQNKNVDRVKGFYFVRYYKVPENDQHRQDISNAIDLAITKLHDDKFYNNLVNISKRHNTPKNMEKGLKRYNTIYERDVPMTFPKLPFF